MLWRFLSFSARRRRWWTIGVIAVFAARAFRAPGKTDGDGYRIGDQCTICGR